jgi:NADH dehydrogenase [ubiquinone] 1 alpha subcomplex assembly factor 7
VNPLAAHLAERIARDGPITIEAYMTACLLDPRHGYYTTREPFGSTGDFITAPEISQMFGELLGLWCWSQWAAAGQPQPAVLAELGPGRGTLLADALRAIEGATQKPAPFDLHLVEASPTLRAKQRETLGGRKVTWHDDAEGLPEGTPCFILANEFFDALPIRQFVATPQGWRERLVTVTNDKLAAAISPKVAPAGLIDGLPEAATGRVAEHAPIRRDVMASLSRRVARDGGCALIIDFDDPKLPLADTFQAVRSHRYADRFEEPGESDLASAVDFTDLARVAGDKGVRVHGPVAQGTFLRSLGIDHRAEQLCRSASPEQIKTIMAALERLVSARGMGNDFKVIGLTLASGPTPEGFGEQTP